MKETVSNKLRHFFHVVSNIRPIIWICLYIGLVPLFALIYWWLPDNQFRIPDNSGVDYGSWLYYSIVTISTLGFGDYTPAHGWAQAVTAIEVMCGLLTLGFFLNAVGSMKSEIDVESEIEKQRKLHEAGETHKLLNSAPGILHNINLFLSYCYAVTTPKETRTESHARFNPDFKFSDMREMFEPSGLATDTSDLPAVERLLRSAERTSLFLDGLHSKVDLTLWPELLEDCFAFVANCQMFSSTDIFDADFRRRSSNGGILEFNRHKDEISQKMIRYTPEQIMADHDMDPVTELYRFIKENGRIAENLETEVTSIVMQYKKDHPEE